MSTGFYFIQRDIKRFLKRLGISIRAGRERGQVLRLLDSQLDDHTLQRLEEMAQQEGTTVDQYTLDLLRYTARLQDPASDQRVVLWRRLTRREQQVAALACQGCTNPEIASRLSISEETVKKHMSSVLHKFSVKGRGVLRWMLSGWDFDQTHEPWAR